VSETQAPTRAGFIAIIGAPNSGKSTLINALVGGKVSIVTHKVQTTRMRVRGVAIVATSQLVFVDTPGIFAPRRRLDRAMVAAAWAGAAEADLVALLVDVKAYLGRAQGGAAAHAADDTDLILTRLKEHSRPAILVLNKIDLVARLQLLALTAELNAKAKFTETFMISAQTGDGVEDFARHCAALVPEGPWLYPEDQMADVPLRQLAAEIVREKLMLRLHDELPYASTVETEKWEERRDGSVRIEATIYVTRESQRAIVLGEKGRTIKEIGQTARTEISALLGRPAHLFLFVKVRENWADDPERYLPLGLDFPKGS
jgi:GTP-binding protein Era